VAGVCYGRCFDPFLLLYLLDIAESQGAVAAGIAYFHCDGSDLAGGQVPVSIDLAASGFEGVVWAVLCFGGIDFLGLCFWIDSVCWGAVQRCAVGAWKQGSGNRCPKGSIGGVRYLAEMIA